MPAHCEQRRWRKNACECECCDIACFRTAVMIDSNQSAFTNYSSGWSEKSTEPCTNAEPVRTPLPASATGMQGLYRCLAGLIGPDG
ncbi:hypothetical protein J6590_049592 [Homalodisca vitripennis]|nr:hypothetical protein J6590_049592 [Homalodisca vitripennis]